MLSDEGKYVEKARAFNVSATHIQYRGDGRIIFLRVENTGQYTPPPIYELVTFLKSRSYIEYT